MAIIEGDRNRVLLSSKLLRESGSAKIAASLILTGSLIFQGACGNLAKGKKPPTNTTEVPTLVVPSSPEPTVVSRLVAPIVRLTPSVLPTPTPIPTPILTPVERRSIVPTVPPDIKNSPEYRQFLGPAEKLIDTVRAAINTAYQGLFIRIGSPEERDNLIYGLYSQGNQEKSLPDAVFSEETAKLFADKRGSKLYLLDPAFISARQEATYLKTGELTEWRLEGELKPFQVREIANAVQFYSVWARVPKERMYDFARAVFRLPPNPTRVFFDEIGSLCMEFINNNERIELILSREGEFTYRIIKSTDPRYSYEKEAPLTFKGKGLVNNFGELYKMVQPGNRAVTNIEEFRRLMAQKVRDIETQGLIKPGEGAVDYSEIRRKAASDLIATLLKVVPKNELFSQEDLSNFNYILFKTDSRGEAHDITIWIFGVNPRNFMGVSDNDFTADGRLKEVSTIKILRGNFDLAEVKGINTDYIDDEYGRVKGWTPKGAKFVHFDHDGSNKGRLILGWHFASLPL